MYYPPVHSWLLQVDGHARDPLPASKTNKQQVPWEVVQYRGPVHATLDIPRPATVSPPIPNKAATPGVNADVAAVEAAKSTAAPQQ